MDPLSSWKKILELIKSQISSTNFKTWFSQTSLDQITEDQILIAVPSAFIKEQLILRYAELISTSVEEVLNKKLSLNFKIDSSLLSKKEPLSEDESFEFSSPLVTQKVSTLNPKFTLANFVVGLTNNLAYAAAQAVVQNPGISYNPLFIYGPSGVGKTHLMHAIGNALILKNPFLKLIFASSERFMVDFVDSIQTKKTGEFRTKYRSPQLLLIDDIQFISGKESTQEEFFHTFNELHSKNSQIVLTSDRPPNEMTKLESRLSSRFQGGLMVDVQLPDFETRVAILQSKLKERGEELPEEFVKLIAEVAESNTRELEGKLIQILQIYKLNPTITLENIKKFLGKPLSHTPLIQYDHKKVLIIINQYFNTKMSDLTGPRRQKGLVLPRQIAMYILYEDLRIPMEKIGDILGGRDHTTILHGIEKIRGNILVDKELQRLVFEVKQNLSN